MAQTNNIRQLIKQIFGLSVKRCTILKVKADGRLCYLSAVCMGCLEGWTSRLQCKNGNCGKLWDGSQLILGTMYSYDIFAAVPCCADRLKVIRLAKRNWQRPRFAKPKSDCSLEVYSSCFERFRQENASVFVPQHSTNS